MVNGIEIITGRWDVVERLFVPTAIKKWDELLDAGYRIAAVSGSFLNIIIRAGSLAIVRRTR